MEENPFDISLRTHGVIIRGWGNAYSSSATGDIRIGWKFDDSKKYIIICLTIAGHDDIY